MQQGVVAGVWEGSCCDCGTFDGQSCWTVVYALHGQSAIDD